jgi:hypothetical protein
MRNIDMKIKSIAAIAAAITLAAPVAYADNTGCGLGTVLFEGNTGKASEILAVTTNGLLSNQNFGITFGTLNCKPDQKITSMEVQLYASANMDKLARDMAVGEGETLDSLADLMQISAADRAEFFALTKSSFDEIYPSPDVTTGEMLAALQQAMSRDSTLAKYTT